MKLHCTHIASTTQRAGGRVSMAFLTHHHRRREWGGSFFALQLGRRRFFSLVRAADLFSLRVYRSTVDEWGTEESEERGRGGGE